MAASRNPGPAGVNGFLPDVNDGTSTRQVSPLPGPVNSCFPLATPLSARNRTRAVVAEGGLPVLSKGSKGKYVRWAQVLLNQHKAADPMLEENGNFGPTTVEAVTKFQRSVSLRPNGVMNKETWFQILVVAPPPQPAAVRRDAVVSVADWTLRHRFEEVLRLTPNHMLPELGAQFRKMLTPANIALVAGTLTAWAVSHAFGAGEVIDLILLVAGTIFIGMGVFSAAEDLIDCIRIALAAETESDLDKAAGYLAQAVAILGITAFFALIAKVGARIRGAGAIEDGAPPGAGAEAPAPKSPSPPEEPEAAVPDPAEIPAGKGLRRQIELHKQKLADYMRDPDASDNKDFLKNAPPELRQKIIESRIKSLQAQIDNFTQQLEKLTSGE